MDFILYKIEQKIYLSKFCDQVTQINLYRIWHEYILTAFLSYLYNNSIKTINSELLDQTISELSGGCSAGKIIEISNRFGDHEDLFPKEIKKLFNEGYVCLRNNDWGHTLSCEPKDYDRFLNNLINNYAAIKKLNFPFLQKKYRIHKILRQEGQRYLGIRYEADGSMGYFEVEPTTSNVSFDTNSLYIFDLINDKEPIDYKKYKRISPFIDIDRTGDHIYLFNKIKKKNLGKVVYHHLFEKRPEEHTIDWQELIYKKPDFDSKTIETENGTTINRFELNYGNKFVDEIASHIANEIRSFLKYNSTAIAVVRGMGGVGKTATVQKICHELAYENKESYFSHVIFVSAKKRFFDYKEGAYRDISSENSKLSNIVSSFNDIQRELQEILSLPQECNDDEFCFSHLQDKILLVIDDFESFEEKESEKIQQAINRLDLNYHRVIITTRDQKISSSKVIPTSNLNADQCLFFLKKIHEFNDAELEKLEKTEVKNAIWKGTKGYPIVILHLSEVIHRRGFDNAIGEDFINSPDVFEYMYGNMYETLTDHAKELFCIMSLFLQQPTDTNKGIIGGAISDLKFVFTDEDDEDAQLSFTNALDDLKEYRILIVDEDTFEITTPLIIKLMKGKYEKSNPTSKNIWSKRYAALQKEEQNTKITYANIKFPQLLAERQFDEIYKHGRISLENKMLAVITQAKYYDSLGKDGYHVYSERKPLFKGSNIYTKYTIQWAKYARTKEYHKKDAICIIEDFFNEVDMDWNQTQLITLMGLFVLYRCKFIQENPGYNLDKGKDVYYDIGNKLVENINAKKMKFWDPQTVHYGGCALYSMAELLNIEGIHDDAIRICEVMINTEHYHFSNLFTSLKNQIKPSLIQRKTTVIPAIVQTSIPKGPTIDWDVFITDFPIQNEDDARDLLNEITENYIIKEKNIKINKKDKKIHAMLKFESREKEFIDEFNLKKVIQHKGSFTYTSYISVCEYNPKGPDYNINIRNLPKGYSMKEFLELIDGFKPIIVQQPFKTTFSGYPKINATFKEEDVPKIISELNGKKQRGVSIVVSKYEAMVYNYFY